ncbi:MAG: tetratricopeptide repeat protein [Myxococcota bacterium]
MGTHEWPANDRDDSDDRIGETVTLRTEQRLAGQAGRAADPENGDRTIELDGGPSGDSSPVSASERDAPDDLEGVVKARVLETLFGGPARPPMLGRYVVLGPLGQGGMGTVLEAFDRTLDRRVAIKVLHEDLNDQHAARLLREARALATLSHPNVVPVFEADTTGGQTFVVMERVHGQTLRDWIHQHPRPDWRQCVRVFIDAGQGLAAAHAEGLVHRDFKPSNAILDDQGRTRVLDFGLARRIDGGSTDGDRLGRGRGQTEHDQSLDTSLAAKRAGGPAIRARANKELVQGPPLGHWSIQALTKTGVMMGTPAYMPPEQIEGREADARSDQFSFCVSLYEAVYGERPFEGTTLTERMTSMTRGRVRPAPKSSLVPARLRTILLRGLAASPAKRWPSMDALLHQLRTLVTPHSRRWIAVGLTAGLAALGGGLALGQYVEVKERCTGARAQMDGTWDEGRRQQVQAALLGTERSIAPDTWARIEPQLDAYAQTWIDTHTEVCEATSVRGEQSDEALDLRMRCLGQRRATLRATVDVLANANAEVVNHAVKLVAGLPTLARCNDMTWLEQRNQRVPPPEDPNVAAAVEVQRARLVEIAAMHQAGRYAEALEVVEPVVQQAKALGYPPLQAEALARRGRLRQRNGRYAEAEQDLRKAYALGMQHNHDSVALRTARALTFVVGCRLARHAEGRQWGEMVALPLAQRSNEPVQEARILNELGLVLESQGDYADARHHYQRALAIKEEALGLDHLDLATTLNNLGNVAYHQGNYDNARAYHQRALAIRQQALGPDHPAVAASLNNLGNALLDQGNPDDARVHYERVLAIRRETLGPDHPDVAESHNNLGGVSYHQGDMAGARVHFERALAIRQKVLGPDHPELAASLTNLGAVLVDQQDYDNARAYHQQALAILDNALDPDHPDIALSLNNLGIVSARQGDMDDARVYFERALKIWDKALGPDHPNVAASHHNLGLMLEDQGQMQDARTHLEQALAIRQKLLGPDHPKVADSLVGLAIVALQTSDPQSARTYAERAVSLREAATVAPQLLAKARFALAQALWSTRSERARARALAEQARDSMVTADGSDGSDGSNVDLAKIDAWLTNHRVK